MERLVLRKFWAKEQENGWSSCVSCFCGFGVIAMGEKVAWERNEIGSLPCGIIQLSCAMIWDEQVGHIAFCIPIGKFMVFIFYFYFFCLEEKLLWGVSGLKVETETTTWGIHVFWKLVWFQALHNNIIAKDYGMELSGCWHPAEPRQWGPSRL